MKNKLEIHLVKDAEDETSINISANLSYIEAKAATLALLNHLGNAFTKTSVEKLAFLKSIHDEMEKLILNFLLF
ncbi:MAG: hypothetical protein K2N27_12660 [Ruminococcus sp.]|nr:hypothetical protein [Ruminococcus sp.]